MWCFPYVDEAVMYLLTYAFIFIFISLLFCFSFFFLSLLIAQFTAGFVYSRTLSIRSKMAEEISLNACLCVGFVFFLHKAFTLSLRNFRPQETSGDYTPIYPVTTNRFSWYKKELPPIFFNNVVDTCSISLK